MIEIGDTISATVEKLTYGGQGLIRHQGWVIFVEDVAPDEEVEVVITAKKKSFLLANLKRIIRPSPFRKEPPCRYFGKCGGCQIQHLSYDEQLRQKSAWLTESLERLAKVPVDFPLRLVAAKKEFGYRQKIILHGAKGGYIARDNTTLLEIENCPLFSTRSLWQVRKILEACAITETTECDTTILRDEQDVFYFSLFFNPKLPKNADKIVAKFPNVWLSDRSKSLGPNEPLSRMQDGLKIYYSPQVFVQNDPDQSLDMYRDILDTITEGPILDLYCGIGSISLLAAKRGLQAHGVELNPLAIEFAKRSAEENGLTGAHFTACASEEIEKLVEKKKFAVWIVNPPRTGLSEKMIKLILKSKPCRLIYISCKPPTLARDVGILCKQGYKILDATLYDMFAQTTHLETVLQLSLK